jgi:hypothetical protein
VDDPPGLGVGVQTAVNRMELVWDLPEMLTVHDTGRALYPSTMPTSNVSVPLGADVVIEELCGHTEVPATVTDRAVPFGRPASWKVTEETTSEKVRGPTDISDPWTVTVPEYRIVV